ncbi:Exonuclease mut-7 [Mortierella sp. GBA30]|nr:Exonuclease mut-7 [Mortierella sp. GBA30]
MAILSFIKSASSKNKIAAVASTNESRGKASEVNVKSNNKGSAKANTISEFTVSAMAYVSPSGARMRRSNPVTTTPRRSTWTRSERPHAPTQYPALTTASKQSATPSPLVKMTPQSVKQTVSDNNAFLLGQSLLMLFGTLSEYRKEQDLGNVGIIQETIAIALRSHADPPMFIVNSLITVGTVTGIKNLDADFELAISELLVSCLEDYKQWWRENPNAQSTSTSSSTPSEDSSISSYGFEIGPIPDSSTNQLNDLIALNDDDGVSFVQYTQASLDGPFHPTKAQHTGDSAVSLLNDDRAISTFKDVTALRPAASDLIDLSNWDKVSVSSPLSSASTGVISLPSHERSTESPLIEHEEDLEVNSSFQSEKLVLEVDLWQLDMTNKVLPRRKSGQADIKSDLAELIEIFDRHFHPEKVDEEEEEEEKARSDKLGADVESNTDLDEGEGADDSLILAKHREKLLAEIASGKNTLQVYAALEVVDLGRALSCPMKGQDSETYGSALVSQLVQMKRFRECAIIMSRYLECDLSLERELVPRLLEMTDQDAIHRYVDNSVEMCHRVLSHINHQLAFQFYYWGLVNPEMAHAVQHEYSDIPPIKGVGKAKIQTGLVEIAMSLVMRFDLESEQGSFAFLNMFIKFCTVVSLLDGSQLQSPSSSPYAFSSSSSNSSATSSTLSLAEDNRNYYSSPTVTKIKNKCKDYSLKASWRFFHMILDIIKDSLTLKQMTIHHCIEKRDFVAAEFFATKLGMMEYYKEKADFDSNPTIRPLSSSPASLSSTTTTASTSSLLPVDAIARTAITRTGMTIGAWNDLHRPKTSSKRSSSSEPAKVTIVASVYQLPPNVKTVFVDRIEQLDGLASTLNMSTVVAMDTEWLPQIKAYENLSKGPRTAILQLACDFESTVFLVDTIAFLEGPDDGVKFVEVLCGLYCNMSVLKLAYDWLGDQELLETTFPDLYGPQNRLQNFIDLRHIYFKIRDQTNGFRTSSNSYVVRENNDSNDNSNMNSLTDFESWSVVPVVQGMQGISGGLNGLLIRICGMKLDKSQQCSNWEQRPLTDKQCQYAAVDVWCLHDIWAALGTITLI